MGGNFLLRLRPGLLWAAPRPLWLWRLCRQNPGPQGGEGAWLCPGPQLCDALPKVKGKFKHGGCEALVDEVPGQAALGKAGISSRAACSQQGLLPQPLALAGSAGARMQVQLWNAASAHLSPSPLAGRTYCAQVLAPSTQTDPGGARLAASQTSIGPLESEGWNERPRPSSN